MRRILGSIVMMIGLVTGGCRRKEPPPPERPPAEARGTASADARPTEAQCRKLLERTRALEPDAKARATRGEQVIVECLSQLTPGQVECALTAAEPAALATCLVGPR